MSPFDFACFKSICAAAKFAEANFVCTSASSSVWSGNSMTKLDSKELDVSRNEASAAEAAAPAAANMAAFAITSAICIIFITSCFMESINLSIIDHITSSPDFFSAGPSFAMHGGTINGGNGPMPTGGGVLNMVSIAGL